MEHIEELKRYTEEHTHCALCKIDILGNFANDYNNHFQNIHGCDVLGYCIKCGEQKYINDGRKMCICSSHIQTKVY